MTCFALFGFCTTFVFMKGACVRVFQVIECNTFPALYEFNVLLIFTRTCFMHTTLKLASQVNSAAITCKWFGQKQPK